MDGYAGGLLSGLARLRDARTLRASSWDRTGRNRDNGTVPGGGTVCLADIDGPGAITHIWMTQTCRFTHDQVESASPPFFVARGLFGPSGNQRHFLARAASPTAPSKTSKPITLGSGTALATAEDPV